MERYELELKIKRAVEHATPDVLEQILSRCGEARDTVFLTDEIRATPKRKPRSHLFLAAAAALVLVIGGAAGYGGYQQYFAVDSIVELDVNPSIELEVNRRERVLSAQALNPDAEAILDGMDLKNTDLQVAMNAIIGSMLKNGYINDLSNSVLITVENDDLARGSDLQQRLTEEVSAMLETSSVQGAVLSQTLDQNTGASELARQYGISEGKAALIQEVISLNPLSTAEELKDLSINELNLLLSYSNPQDAAQSGGTGESRSSLTSTGAASDKAYIGLESARQLAYEDAAAYGVQESGILGAEVSMDWEDGRMVYEVEFYAAGMEFDYEIDATTGQILSAEREGGEYEGSGQPPASLSGSAVSAEQALAIAFDHAGVSAGQAQVVKNELDEDDGVYRYEIEFYAAGAEYEYEIDAATGAVLKSAGESHFQGQQGQSGAAVTGQEAQSIALAHAGVTAGEAGMIQVERDRDDGREIYEVEFEVRQGSAAGEYDYKIDAATGAILEFDRDTDD